jgi:hypothetical protein
VPKNSVAKPRPNRRGGLWKTKCPLKMGKNEAMKNKMASQGVRK